MLFSVPSMLKPTLENENTEFNMKLFNAAGSGDPEYCSAA